MSLNLGGAEWPEPSRLAHLAAVVQALDAPLVSEHVAFSRAGGLDSGHLLPVPHTWDALAVVAENVRIACASLPVPLVLENVAPLLFWPGDELTEGQFLTELAERTGVALLVDVANLHTARVNSGQDPLSELEELPLERIAYVHVAGGVVRNGVWHDTHTHPVSEPVLEILAELAARVDLPGVLLERDGAYPPDAELAAELTRIGRTVEEARTRRLGAPERVAGRRVRRWWRRGGDVTHRADGPCSADPRGSLAHAQRELLAALVAGADVPPGLDAKRVAIQAAALIEKRRSVVGPMLPGLVDAMGESFSPLFRAYAAEHPRPVGGGRADAQAFLRYAHAVGAVPVEPAPGPPHV